MNDGYNDVDIYEYLMKVKQLAVNDPELFADVDSVINGWYLTRVLEANLNLPTVVGGAAIWFPWHRQYFDGLWDYYHYLEFAHSGWLSLLNRAYGPDEVAPSPPSIIDCKQSMGSILLRLRLFNDPDELTVQVEVQTADSLFTYLYLQEWGTGEVTLRLPVSASGIVTSRCIDWAGNLSGTASTSYTFQPLPLVLEVHPNPMHADSGGQLRWFVPEGISGEGRLTMYNIRGQKVLQRSLGELSDGEGVELPFTWPGWQNLGRGIYLLRLRVGAYTAHARFTIL